MDRAKLHRTCYIQNMIRLLVCALLLSLSSFAGNFVSGTAACAASGNKLVVTLSAPVTVNVLIVQAQYANAGTITIGGSNITSSANGILMNPGDSFSLASTNFS